MYGRVVSAELCDAGLTEFAPPTRLAPVEEPSSGRASLRKRQSSNTCRGEFGPEKILGEPAEAREIRPPRGRVGSDDT
jgi:hypothetical protein